jgi:hypothetical protein
VVDHQRRWEHLTTCPQFYVVPCETHDANEIVFFEDLPRDHPIAQAFWRDAEEDARLGSRLGPSISEQAEWDALTPEQQRAELAAEMDVDVARALEVQRDRTQDAPRSGLIEGECTT